MYNIDKGKFIVSYCGNLGLTQNLEMVINAAKMFEECKDILFLFIGDGANKKNLIEKAKGKANILFLPFQPQQNISEVYSVGNVGLIISKVGIGSNSIPSKIFSMMSASQPILASFDLNSNLARIIKTSDSGYCVEPNNLTALVEMIKHIYKNKDELLFLGGNGRLYLQKKYSKSKSVNEYLNVIQKVTIKK
jgi:glycosyltransferase involved in cell wall biosynthesis